VRDSPRYKIFAEKGLPRAAIFHNTMLSVNMQNIGDRLTEARKRLGIALREASEATKIRTDYLTAMENGTFDFSLPEVYKRGFLKIYARYLKLDAEKLSADFTAQFSGSEAGVRHEDRENLGRVEAPGGFSHGHEATREGVSAVRAARTKQQAETFRLVVIVSVAVLVIVFLIMGFQRLFQSSNAPDATKTASTTESSTVPAPANSTATTNTAVPPAVTTVSSVPGTMKFSFTTTTDITMQVWQMSDNHKIYDGALKKDKPVTLTTKGPIEVQASQTQYLTISINGAPSQVIVDSVTGKRASGSQAFLFPPPSQ